jgi:hypothetical protein
MLSYTINFILIVNYNLDIFIIAPKPFEPQIPLEEHFSLQKREFPLYSRFCESATTRGISKSENFNDF